MSPNKHLPANIIQFETTPEPEVQCSVRIHDYALAKNDYPETIPAVKPYIASDIPTNSILPYLNDIVEQIEIQKKVLDCGNKKSRGLHQTPSDTSSATVRGGRSP